MTDRWPETRNGSMALSPVFHSNTKKATPGSPDPTKRPIILVDLHFKVAPPHCRAKAKQHTDPISKAAPRRSRYRSFFITGNRRSGVSSLSSPKKRVTMTATTPPTGTLIQKNHRQLAWSVSAPPIIGPKQAAAPNELTTML